MAIVAVCGLDVEGELERALLCPTRMATPNGFGRSGRPGPPDPTGSEGPHVRLKSSASYLLGAHLFRLTAASCALVALACAPEPQPEQRIVLITLDTLRYDGLAGQVEGRATMPRTRALAQRGRVFRRSYAASSTTQPTHASLFTGLHPWQHGVPRNGVVMEAELETVTERMRDRGYSTAAVVASFPVHSEFGFDQGFERFEDDFSAKGIQRWNGVAVPGEHFYSRADAVTAKALAQLDELGGTKQFFWFHYFDAHAPYGDAPGAVPIKLVPLKKSLRNPATNREQRIDEARRNYFHDVRYLDQMLGTLYDRLLADAETIETHIVLVSDHGESFGEGNFLGHGKGLTPEQVHVPLFVFSPRVGPGTSDMEVGSIDVAATLDTLSGGNDLPSVGFDLSSDPATWPSGRPVVGMRRTFAEPYENTFADGSTGFVEGSLFYLAEGGREYVGTAADLTANDGDAIDEAIAARVQALFGTFEAELSGRAHTERVDEATQRALEALGYTR